MRLSPACIRTHARTGAEDAPRAFITECARPAKNEHKPDALIYLLTRFSLFIT